MRTSGKRKWHLYLTALPFIVYIFILGFGVPFQAFDLYVCFVIALAIRLISILFQKPQQPVLITTSNFKPNKQDKKNINELLRILNVEMFEDEIRDKNAWYGYKARAILNTIYFEEAVNDSDLKICDKVLNGLLIDLKDALSDFNDYSAKQLYQVGRRFILSPDLDLSKDEAAIAVTVMNKKTEFAFKKLTALLKYLEENNYMTNDGLFNTQTD